LHALQNGHSAVEQRFPLRTDAFDCMVPGW
jgi:hypothetical protein